MPKKEDSLLPTQCNEEFLKFHPLDKGEVRGGFDGGAITRDAGGLLRREGENPGVHGAHAGHVCCGDPAALV